MPKVSAQTEVTQLDHDSLLYAAHWNGAAYVSRRVEIGTLREHVNIKDYGALGDATDFADGVAVAADATFTSALATFTSADVGKTICIPGAGAAGAMLVTTIASRNDANSIELTAAAGTSVPVAWFIYGADDTTAIEAAKTAAYLAGLPLHIPAGRYLLTDTIEFHLPITVYGDGCAYSILIPAMGITKNALEFGDSTLQSRNGWIVRDFSVLGGAGSCLNAIQCLNLNRIDMDNITIFTGTAAAGYGLELQGCIYGTYHGITIRTNPTYPDAYMSGAALPTNGVHVTYIETPGNNQSQCNVMEVFLSGFAGDALVVEDHDGWYGGDLDVSGTIEGTTGYSLKVSGCWFGTYHDLHFESAGAVLIHDCKNVKIGPNFTYSATGAVMTVDACVDTCIDNVRLTALTINSNSTGTILGQINMQSTAFVDNGVGTIKLFPINIAGIANQVIPADAAAVENLIANAWFEDWTAGVPTGWTDPGWTYTKTGDGLADTTKRFGRYAAKVVSDDTSYLTYTVPTDKRFSGNHVTFSIWTYTPTPTASDGQALVGDATFTSATAVFVAGAVGSSITIDGAGAGGIPLVTTIALRNSDHSIELAVAPSTEVLGATFTYYAEGPIIKLVIGASTYYPYPANYGTRDAWAQSYICALCPAGQEGNISIGIGGREMPTGFYLSGPSLSAGPYIAKTFSASPGDSSAAIHIQGLEIGANVATKTIIKTISCNDDASVDDYQFDDDAANHDEQVITLTNILPAYAELISWQIRCFETVTGSAAMVVKLGTSSGGTEVGTGSPDTAADIIGTAAGGSPVLAATNVARSLYFAGDPDANWNTPLNAGRWAVMITYVDYAPIYSLKLLGW